MTKNWGDLIEKSGKKKCVSPYFEPICQYESFRWCIDRYGEKYKECLKKYRKKDYKMKIWIYENKNYIISELKGLIDIVEDEHSSTPSFFRRCKECLDKWEKLYKQEKEIEENE